MYQPDPHTTKFDLSACVGHYNSSMPASFFFYDLETSGFNPRSDRIMQFAGIRTDAHLRPLGEPYNILIKMTPDTLPSPDAVLITGITPQATLADGVTEAQFLKLFYEEIVQPDTCFLGYNTVRFDDEFMRFLHYRNFYDPYEWHWCDSCSRWDLLDVVRITRALRPEGIQWPFDKSGKPTNRLELLTKLNGIEHYAAHDALSDVHATIAVATLIRDKQPKLFNFMFEHRHKKVVQELVSGGKPFVYSSGRYPSEFEKTTVAVKITDHPQPGRGSYVYDLRHDPEEFINLTPEQLVERWQYTADELAPKRLPVKLLQYNHCPAVAPIGVLDESAQQRVKIDLRQVQRNLRAVQSAAGFAERLVRAAALLEERRVDEREQRERDQYGRQDQRRDQPGQRDRNSQGGSLRVGTGQASKRGVLADVLADVDAQLYDGFLGPNDKQIICAVRAAQPGELALFADRLSDVRLRKLLPRYKARNYPESLTDDERQEWEAFCRQRLLDGGPQSPLARYFSKLQALAAASSEHAVGAVSEGGSSNQSYLLEELQLYGQSIMPVYDGE